MDDRPLRVLLIEDSPTDALLVQETLADLDSSAILTAVERLSHGLQYCEDAACDVVLLDLGLPDSQGMASLEKLRS
ncbi:MAG TPA: response regulator [Candidatus Tectomicrobia bacterium]|jgi:two-component system sensor histidine kinase UhpB